MIVGGMATPFERVALSRFDELYASAPTDLLFGEGVTPASLNGRAVSRSLDLLFGTDLEELSWQCAERCCERYGLNSDIYHMDATNVPVYAITENISAGDIPAAMFGGNSKTGRNDLRQYDAMGITDGNRILRYLRAYSGNTSDTVMDADAVAFLKEHVDPGRSCIVADCKIVTEGLIGEMCA